MEKGVIKEAINHGCQTVKEITDYCKSKGIDLKIGEKALKKRLEDGKIL